MLTRRGEGARCANTGTPSAVQPTATGEGSQSRAYGSTNGRQSSVSASARVCKTVCTTLVTAIALGLFLAVLALAGYAAEHTPTLVALAVCPAAIVVVLVRLAYPGGAK